MMEHSREIVAVSSVGRDALTSLKNLQEGRRQLIELREQRQAVCSYAHQLSLKSNVEFSVQERRSERARHGTHLILGPKKYPGSHAVALPNGLFMAVRYYPNVTEQFDFDTKHTLQLRYGDSEASLDPSLDTHSSETIAVFGSQQTPVLLPGNIEPSMPELHDIHTLLTMLDVQDASRNEHNV